MNIGSREWLDWHGGSIACPIPWCTGSRGEHGGEGDGPDSWLHTDAGRTLSDAATLFRYQEGSGAVFYSVLIGTQTVIEDAQSLAAVADTFRGLANACEALAYEDGGEGLDT